MYIQKDEENRKYLLPLKLVQCTELSLFDLCHGSYLKNKEIKENLDRNCISSN